MLHISRYYEDEKAFSFICVGLMALSCTGERADDLISQNFAFADQQLRYALTETENVRNSLGKTPEELPSPRNIQSDGSLRLVRARDWCSGFSLVNFGICMNIQKMISGKKGGVPNRIIGTFKII